MTIAVSDGKEYRTYQQEFWLLNDMDDLALVYMEIKNHLDLFLDLFHLMKKNKLVNPKDIKAVLKYAAELPSLENKFRSLANTVLDLEIKKKELSAQLIDLAQVINQYQGVIDSKKAQVMKIDKYPLQPANHHTKSKLDKMR
jgi:hypothetical protein